MFGHWTETDSAQWTACAVGVDALYTEWIVQAVEVAEQEPAILTTLPPGTEISTWLRDHLEQHRGAFCGSPIDPAVREAARRVGFAHITAHVLPSWYISLYNLMFAAYHALESGATPWQLPPLAVLRRRWLDDMEVTLDTYAVAVTTQVTDLSNLALTDPLTGLFNRRGFWQRVTYDIDHGVRHAAFLLLDLDHFKAVNDLHGHPVGDQVLQKLAALEQASARPSDAMARLGGDEFAWWVVGMMDARVLHRRLQGISDDLRHHQGLTFSIGAAWYPESGCDVEQLYQRADEALYQAKRGGRACLTIAGQDQIYRLQTPEPRPPA